jgi:hypothetical protein
MIRFLRILLLLCLSLFLHCTRGTEQRLIGAKIYEHPGPYDQLFDQWNRMGINTAFCSQALISNHEFMQEARKHRISTFMIFPVFFNPEALAEDPGLAAINRNGEPAVDEWVEFVCPSREPYRLQMVEQVRQMVREHRPDGISIDFIRHFVYWEKVYPDRDPVTLPVCCFDSVCMARFQAETGTDIPGTLTTTEEQADWILDNHEAGWTAWHCAQITSMVAAIVRAAIEEKPDIRVNIHLVPWTREDFNGAIRRVAGQDVPALSQFCDYLSPMTYAHMVRQPPSWIHHIVEDIYGQTRASILPSIQVGKAYLDTGYGQDEFKMAIDAALQLPSSGLILWSWERLMAEPEKAALFKDMMAAR